MDPTPEHAAALTVEQHACPTCAVPAGSACRTRGGNTAFRYHTARFLLVLSLGNAAEVLVPDDREPGKPWHPGSSVVEPLRIGYAYVSPIAPEGLQSQLDSLAAAQCGRIFTDLVAASVKRRPQLDEAMRLARETRRAAPSRLVMITVTDLGRLARTSGELIAASGELRAGGVALEVLGGPLSGTYDPLGAGALLFASLAAAAELDRDHRRNKTLEGQQAAAAKGRRSGRPRVLDEDMLTLARTLRGQGVPVPEIAEELTVTTGKNAGHHPSVASVYRALAESEPGDLEGEGAAPLADPALR